MSDLIRLMVGPEHPDDNAQFGVLMRDLRDKAGFTRTQAADVVGLSSEFLRLIERGNRAPAAGTMRVILEGYRVPFEVMRRDDNAVIIFYGHSVEFTSRIQEARRKGQRPLAEDYNDHRDKQIGRIVSLLTIADEQTLDDIYKQLA